MNEILFRGQVKDKDELIGKGFTVGGTMNPISEWVYGVPIPRYPDLFLAWNEGNGEYEEITVIPESIGKYIGWTDKNGVKIFDGDFVKYSEIDIDGSDLVGLGVISWNQETACFTISNGAYRNDFCRMLIEEIEVIGNIFDNPELLKGSAENA